MADWSGWIYLDRPHINSWGTNNYDQWWLYTQYRYKREGNTVYYEVNLTLQFRYADTSVSWGSAYYNDYIYTNFKFNYGGEQAVTIKGTTTKDTTWTSSPGGSYTDCYGHTYSGSITNTTGTGTVHIETYCNSGGNSFDSPGWRGYNLTIPQMDTYTIAYNANGGIGAPGNQTKEHNVALTLSTTTPSKANTVATAYTVTYNGNGGTVVGSTTATNTATTSYSFQNWNTSQDGTGTSYSPGGSYTANSGATLFAQWTSSSPVYSSVTLPSGFRSGYSLLGWSTNSSATTPDSGKTVGANFTPSSNTILYAVWKIQDVSLRFAQEVFDLIYPIGSIYLTMANVDPSTLFGGAWVRIGVGRTLVSAGGGIDPVEDSNTYSTRGNYTGDSTWFIPGERGGELDHVLATGEMPAHRHWISSADYDDGNFSTTDRSNSQYYGIAADAGTYNINDTCKSYGRYDAYAGGSGGTADGRGSSATAADGHNNMQPYVAVYMWQRTA